MYITDNNIWSRNCTENLRVAQTAILEFTKIVESVTIPLGKELKYYILEHVTRVKWRWQATLREDGTTGGLEKH